MRTAVAAACVCLGFAAIAAAQPPPGAEDIAKWRDAIKDLKWKDIDPAKLSLLERCRSLMLLNHALDELIGAGTAQADMMSEYIDQKQLGQEFASNPPPVEPRPFTFDDAVKMGVALLRGPMSQSSYASELAETDEQGLKAYENLYEATCQRKWSEVGECRRQLRAMLVFLKGKDKLKEFSAWAPGEVERRQQAYEAEMAQRRSAAVAKAEAKTQADQQRATEAQQQRLQAQQQAASAQLQMAMAAAQQSAAQPSQQTTTSSGDDDWFPGWYYGVPANMRRNAWYNNAGWRGESRAQTAARVSSWHGGGGGGRGGRR